MQSFTIIVEKDSKMKIWCYRGPGGDLIFMVFQILFSGLISKMFYVLLQSFVNTLNWGGIGPCKIFLVSFSFFVFFSFLGCFKHCLFFLVVWKQFSIPVGWNLCKVFKAFQEQILLRMFFISKSNSIILDLQIYLMLSWRA